MARRVARWLPFYEYGDAEFFACDGAPTQVAAQRRTGFAKLSQSLQERAPMTLQASQELEHGLADLQFVNLHRVPFQFRNRVRRDLPIGSLLAATDNHRQCDLDGNWSVDVTGAYGTNLFGYDFYRHCIAHGVTRAEAVGPVLGPYHPVMLDNVARLRQISGMDQVSFHMSGTEAVMQAVRLARYHTRRSHIVRLCGSYHGWWDGVQAGVGNPRPAREVYTLRDMSERTLKVLSTRNNIACVLVNPLQALHPNQNAPSDSMLVTGERKLHYDRAAYQQWLRALRAVCSKRGIALIFDEVFVGFRLALGGAQEYFGVRADLVTYGKTLGGGLPVGVVCGMAKWMQRYRENHPADVCFARGTFNSHPYVMTAMNEFLRFLERPTVRASYHDLDKTWSARMDRVNSELHAHGLPVRVDGLTSIWTTEFTQPSRYNWLLQYYLRLEGIATSWIGTARFIFTHDLSDAEFEDFAQRFVRASKAMQADGFWWLADGATSKTLQRRIVKEMLAAFGRRRGKLPEVATTNQPTSEPTSEVASANEATVVLQPSAAPTSDNQVGSEAATAVRETST
jgi:glutamate-1-semialdehyde 2,1-aminomutase